MCNQRVSGTPKRSADNSAAEARVRKTVSALRITARRSTNALPSDRKRRDEAGNRGALPLQPKGRKDPSLRNYRLRPRLE
ncbi:hypothetical protein SKAU_G00084690 [Synaphobranchus kaupii]|uniref:Uncharacterized protein n=1 Tax=Synaphobranchus kaupii TaxID=118154 RepID=A0A9Q1FVI0_SYNKA|nr:hypothetical protein SKAU_G00084690 [Synaphobranchus kaupii]